MNDTSNIELKPCPFCGKTNAKRHCDHASGWIGCECGASGPRIKLDVDRYPGDSFRPNEEQKVISAWNRRAALSPAELGGVDYRKIAHEIYCHAGQCHGEPLCFLAEDEDVQARWIDAVQTVIAHHLSTPRAAEAVTDGDALFLLECADTLAKDFRHHMADKLRELVKQKALTPPSAKGE